MTIIYEIESVVDFYNILQNNNGGVVIKFGAEWCAPCHRIAQPVANWFQKLEQEHTNIQLIYIDVDKSFELYAFLKTRKMIQGIPAILAYYKGNTTYVFDDSVAGTNEDNIDIFFQTVISKTAIPASTLLSIK